MPWTAETDNALPAFIADPGSVRKIPGRQVNWDGVNASFLDAGTGKKRFKAGQVVAEVPSTGKIIEYGGTDNSVSPAEAGVALGILASEANEDAEEEALSGYGIYTGGVIFENLLPGATGGPPKVLAAQTKTDLTTAKCAFQFVEYADTRAA